MKPEELILSQEHLRWLFIVNLRAGRLTWKNPPKYHPDLRGREAGHPQSNRSGKVYWVVQINGRKHKRGRLIYFLKHNHWPFPQVDHKNGNSLDDRPSNLREATQTQNAWNHKHRARRIPLPMGVRANHHTSRFEARISFHKRQIHLGGFDTADAAHRAYLAKRKELYGEFA